MSSNQNMLDLTNLAEDLHEASEVSGMSIHEMMLSFAQEMQADMQAHAHVVTGKMRANIVIKDEPGKITVGVDDDTVPYAKYEVYGTKPHVIRPKEGKKVLAFRVNGKMIYVKQVNHPGTPAHDFVTPAVERFLDLMGEDSAKIGVNLIVKGHA